MVKLLDFIFYLFKKKQIINYIYIIQFFEN